MHAAIDSFIRYLRIERNASALTLKSYAEDLASLLEDIRNPSLLDRLRMFWDDLLS